MDLEELSSSFIDGLETGVFFPGAIAGHITGGNYTGYTADKYGIPGVKAQYRNFEENPVMAKDRGLKEQIVKGIGTGIGFSVSVLTSLGVVGTSMLIFDYFNQKNLYKIYEGANA